MDQPTTNQMTTPAQPPTSAGGQQNSSAWIAYLFGWLTGLYFYFTTKNQFIKFHAVQSIILFGGLHIVRALFGSGYRLHPYGSMMSYGFGYSPVMGLVNLAAFVLWIFLMIKAHKGEKFKLPTQTTLCATKSPNVSLLLLLSVALLLVCWAAATTRAL